MVVSKLGHLVSGNCLSAVRRQVIIWTDVGLSFIGPWRTNIIVILIEIKIYLLHESIWKHRLQTIATLSLPQCVDSAL